MNDLFSAFARAALTAAGYNVRINVQGLQGKDTGAHLVFELEGLELRATEIEKELKATLNERGGLNIA